MVSVINSFRVRHNKFVLLPKMKKFRQVLILLFLLFAAVIVDTLLYILKKTKNILFFPGG